MIHCCGSSSWAFEDFIEMGIRAVDTLQPEAADMDEKHERVMTALASLRDDMNGEFKTVNERVSNAEREHLQLREDIRELRRSR